MSPVGTTLEMELEEKGRFNLSGRAVLLSGDEIRMEAPRGRSSSATSPSAGKPRRPCSSAALFPIQNPSSRFCGSTATETLLFSNPAAGPVLAEWRTASGTGIPGRGSVRPSRQH
ncbi:MAG: hypothetical protein MZU97_07805 [Bacillus subtilis]|nr:hypothetical protein [Bacillus subtilis]